MPFDDFDPDLKHNSNNSLVQIAKIIENEKCLWAACRNQSKPIKKVSGILLILHFWRRGSVVTRRAKFLVQYEL